MIGIQDLKKKGPVEKDNCNLLVQKILSRNITEFFCFVLFLIYPREQARNFARPSSHVAERGSVGA